MISRGRFAAITAIGFISALMWFIGGHKEKHASQVERKISSAISKNQSNSPPRPPLPRTATTFKPLKQDETAFQLRDRLARDYSTVGGGPVEAEAVQAQIEHFSNHDVDRLRKDVLDSNQDLKTRRASLYLLTRCVGAPCEAAAEPALTEIAGQRVPKFAGFEQPHTLGSYLYEAEVSMRITALEALDQMASSNAPSNSHPVRQELKSILARQDQPTLRWLAQLSLIGIAQGRPGKLGRFIDEVLKKGDRG